MPAVELYKRNNEEIKKKKETKKKKRRLNEKMLVATKIRVVYQWSVSYLRLNEYGVSTLKFILCDCLHISDKNN